MKYLLSLAALALTMWGGTSWGYTKHPEPRHPYISSNFADLVIPQYESPHWDRFIAIRNPLRRPVWVWLECASHLKTNAMSISKLHTGVFTFTGIPADEKCEITRWEYKHGNLPPRNK